MKKILFAVALLIPTSAFADRFGSIRSGADVPLSTQTIRNQDTLQSGATFYISSGTVAGQFVVSGTQGTRIVAKESVSPPYSRVVEAYVGEIGGNAGSYRISVTTRTSLSNPGTSGQTDLIISGVGENEPYIYYYVDGANPFGVRKAGAEVTGTFSVSEATTLAFLAASSITVTSSIIADTVIGSNSGEFNVHGETVTFAVPPLDGIDRIPTLNGTAVSWSAAVTDGETYSSSDTYSVTIATNGVSWDSLAISIGQLSSTRVSTIQSVYVYCSAGTSLTFNLQERAKTSEASAGTVITSSALVADTDGAEYSVFSNASIAAGASLFLVTGAGAESGVVYSVTVVITYTETP